MCLEAQIDKGVNKKIYGRICTDICYTYGMQHVISLSNLAKMGLFYWKGSQNESYRFSDVKKELKLSN